MMDVACDLANATGGPLTTTTMARRRRGWKGGEAKPSLGSWWRIDKDIYVYVCICIEWQRGG